MQQTNEELEQYGRRLCVRTDDVSAVDNETSDEVLDKVKSLIKETSCETFLDSSISNEDERINIKSYNLLRTDHPSNNKRGGVSMYYKEHFPIIKRDDFCTLKK